MGASFLAALHDGDLVGDELCDTKYVNNGGGNAHADTRGHNDPRRHSRTENSSHEEIRTLTVSNRQRLTALASFSNKFIGLGSGHKAVNWVSHRYPGESVDEWACLEKSVAYPQIIFGIGCPRRCRS